MAPGRVANSLKSRTSSPIPGASDLVSRLNLDDRYLHFCELVTSQVVTAMANASELVAELMAINRRLSARA
jgi:hypothetical protein